MEGVIKDIGERLQGMREILGISADDMASVTGVSVAEYVEVEAGARDFSFTFLYKAAQKFGIDLTELMTGESPRLSGYALTRAGEGLPIERRAGFCYLNLASRFRGRTAEPFMVTAPYETGAEQSEIALNTHAGQEMDFVIEGTLRMKIGDKVETLQAGDSIYYDSSRPHGMVAVGGTPCRFLAIVIGHSARQV